MKNYSACDFVDLIDSKFEEYVGTIGRTDTSWGIWSRKMNIMLRKQIEGGTQDSPIFGIVFAYWIVMSQLLDLLYDCKGLRRILREKKIKAKTEEALDLRNRILSESY
jgi:hypothetical protein